MTSIFLSYLDVYSSFHNLLVCQGIDGKCPGCVTDSHPLNKTETGDKRRPYEPTGLGEVFSLITHKFMFNDKHSIFCIRSPIF